MPSFRPRLSPTGWTTVVIIGLALLLTVGALRPVQRVLVPVFRPIGSIAYSVVDRVAAIFRDRTSTADVKKENEELRARLVQAELDRASLNQQLTELRLTREEQEFLKHRSLQGISGRVIGRSQTNAQVLLIDAGSAQGVREGAPVLASGGVLVGVVSNVSEETSSVRLLTAEGTNIAVRVDKQDGPSGLLVGERGVGTRLTLVPQTDTLQPKQSVITSDMNPQIPSGLLIGTISSVESSSGALFQSATVVPAVPYERLNVLMVVKRT